MLERIRSFFHGHRDLGPYLLFGSLTTVINYGIYLPLYNSFGVTATASNLIAWAVSVMFAFWTNKSIVYRSRDWHGRTVVRQMVRFFGCRAGTGLAETALLFLSVDLLSLNGNLMKLLVSLFVVCINYVMGRTLVFHKR
ncbi:MAG: GtrA family protein [Oscillospiraceae bacterium]|nr:GtrA family protein [Oscillospiraceae bacterium]